MRGCVAEGIDYRGLLYPGVMLTKAGPKILEFNARFGDPETQVYLTRLENDLVELLDASVNGTLDKIEMKWKPEASVCVVMASGGYPGNYAKGKPILGLAEAAKLPNTKVFHAGTALKNGQSVTVGYALALAISNPLVTNLHRQRPDLRGAALLADGLPGLAATRLAVRRPPGAALREHGRGDARRAHHGLATQVGEVLPGAGGLDAGGLRRSPRGGGGPPPLTGDPRGEGVCSLPLRRGRPREPRPRARRGWARLAGVPAVGALVATKTKAFGFLGPRLESREACAYSRLDAACRGSTGSLSRARSQPNQHELFPKRV